MNLPIPDPIASAHSERLTSLIRQEIQKEEFISFARFMELALYTPGLGYYSAGAHKLGRGGDFITAPEISPLFAKCIAKQCQQVLESGNNDILEIGAGTGALAKDLLLALEKNNCLPEHYYILETSADLRDRQKSLLESLAPTLFSRISWLDTLPVQSISGVVIANEVLDALPVHCFCIDEQRVLERCVSLNEHGFKWVHEINSELSMHVTTMKEEMELSDGYESEINLGLASWTKAIANLLKKGIILFIDYGYGQREYYHPDRTQGTLMCYYQHHKHSDPFQLIGLQDITAHVDFTRVIEGGFAAGLELSGYTTQSAFLLACGLLDLVEINLSEKEIFQQNQAIKRLTMPTEMGEAIKVVALNKDFNDSLIGFSLHDRRRDL